MLCDAPSLKKDCSQYSALEERQPESVFYSYKQTQAFGGGVEWENGT